MATSGGGGGGGDSSTTAGGGGEGECVNPPVKQEFQTARLLLTHLGVLSIDSLQVTVLP